MRRRLAVLALCCLVALPLAACRSALSERRVEEIERGDLMSRRLLSYHVAHSAQAGNVGYVKVFAVREAGGHEYPWKYVYDQEWNELGFVDQFGNAFVYQARTEFERDIHGSGLRVRRLPSDSSERNVARILGLDPALHDMTFPEASRADILGG